MRPCASDGFSAILRDMPLGNGERNPEERITCLTPLLSATCHLAMPVYVLEHIQYSTSKHNPTYAFVAAKSDDTIAVLRRGRRSST